MAKLFYLKQRSEYSIQVNGEWVPKPTNEILAMGLMDYATITSETDKELLLDGCIHEPERMREYYQNGQPNTFKYDTIKLKTTK